MPGRRRIVADMTDIGEQAKPPFAVLPDPSLLFFGRAQRLGTLMAGHELEPYLAFLKRVAEIQHGLSTTLPPAPLPPAEQIARAHEHGMPPLSRASIEPDAMMLATVEQLVTHLAQEPIGEAPVAAASALQAVMPTSGRDLITAALREAPPLSDVAQQVLILAGLQVHFTRLAAQLEADNLKPVAHAACPTCGSPPIASTVVSWPKAYNTRYCTCALCGTMWNVIRVMCVLCGATDGVSFRGIDGQPDTIKAETCDTCRGYVKIVYQVNDMALEALCDDVASVGLDMLLAEEGWKRGGQNPFLLGY